MEPYPWGDTRRFNSYSGYFNRLFGGRVQKITVNAGFTCPNRDGTKGTGGCTFCNNEAFTPSYCMRGNGIEWQIAEGIEFHRRRYRWAERFLVYFQSYSNTYADRESLEQIYGKALSVPDVAGIVVGTRPDCVDEGILDYFEQLSREKYVTIEYGVESCSDATLGAVNRGHDFRCAAEAIARTRERGIHVGAHFILGLPGESDSMLLSQVDKINSLGLDTVKFHQLQIIKGTAMEQDYRSHPEKYRFWTLSEYIDLFIGILRRLDPCIVVERFAGEAPPRYHAGPTWGMVRNEQLLDMLEKRLAELDVRQGDLFETGILTKN